MMNKTIVVVGASRGIGKEIVLNFAKDKEATVIALSRNTAAMRAAYNKNKNVITAFADLASKDLHEQLRHVLKDVPTVDIVIFTAGVIVNKPFLELSREEIDTCFQTNSVGIMSATQAFVPKMLQHGGHIVNISTMGAFQGSVKFPGLAAYSASKAGIVTFTELFAEEFKATKIRMNCLCLGAVQTEMLETAFPGYQAPISAKEMSDYIVNFANNGAQFYNGKILPVSSSTP